MHHSKPYVFTLFSYWSEKCQLQESSPINWPNGASGKAPQEKSVICPLLCHRLDCPHAAVHLYASYRCATTKPHAPVTPRGRGQTVVCPTLRKSPRPLQLKGPRVSFHLFLLKHAASFATHIRIGFSACVPTLLLKIAILSFGTRVLNSCLCLNSEVPFYISCFMRNTF